jgi:CRP/FNR family transcriptional regulator, anaerobic regulatory protein
MSVSVISRNLQCATEFPITQEQMSSDRSQACEVIELRAAVLSLNQGEDLFRAGDPKTHLYRVESGCLCIYEPNSAEHRVVVQFAFAGDMPGLGYLENHTHSARAIGETRVTCLPMSAVDRITEAGPPARDQLQQAIDNELEFVRDGLVRSGQRNPIERVAAFFVALSRGNSYEGRLPNIIADSVKCGVVASYLALDIEDLASILVELEDRRLIESCQPSGLRLNDIAALERLADGRETLAPSIGPDLCVHGKASAH